MEGYDHGCVYKVYEVLGSGYERPCGQLKIGQFDFKVRGVYIWNHCKMIKNTVAFC